MSAHPAYEQRRQALAAGVAALAGAPLALSKTTSNLFRPRAQGAVRRLDLGAFTHVLDIDMRRGFVDVEGLATYEALADATLAAGGMPQVVPQLKSITIGGAVTGGGIESSSFKFGFVHETIEELDILLGDGAVVTATKANEYSDLFHGFPNSYGTFGYALRVRARTTPVRRFVKLTHRRYATSGEFYRGLREACDSRADFVDGVIFAPDDHVLTLGEMTDEAPYASNYRYRRIYYRSLRERETDYLTIYDYLWRWDADWFWCSKHFGMQNPVVRCLFGWACLRSTFYGRLMRLNQRYGIAQRLGRARPSESVIQDVQIPIGECEAFERFFHERIGIRPVWVCPSRSPDRVSRYTLYPTDPAELYVNFGFWDVIPSNHPAGHFNRQIEQEVAALRGMKSLYSSSFYPREEFDRFYNGAAYAALKRKYDPQGRLKGLYEKCVQRR